MPDLTLEARTVCQSCIEAELPVTGSKGDEYTVRWGKLPAGAPTEYGFTCTCPSFVHRQQECKHIREVKGSFCHAGMDAFAGGAGLGEVTSCPDCGGPVTGVQVAT